MPPFRMSLVLLLLVAVGLSGCASGGLTAEPSSYGSSNPRTAVERFLQAANRQDYVAMGQQFGTRKGPAEERLGADDLEKRMIVLAKFLRHDGYELRRDRGRRTEPYRARFVATMTGTRSGQVAVPIIAVEDKKGRWFVEQIEMEPLTRQGGGQGR